MIRARRDPIHFVFFLPTSLSSNPASPNLVGQRGFRIICGFVEDDISYSKRLVAVFLVKLGHDATGSGLDGFSRATDSFIHAITGSQAFIPFLEHWRGSKANRRVHEDLAALGRKRDVQAFTPYRREPSTLFQATCLGILAAGGD